jgi:hypothetical protein
MGASAQAAPTETRSDENTLRAVVRAGLEAAAWPRHGRGGAGKPAVAQHLQTVPEQQANFLQVLIGRSVFLRKSPTRQLATGRPRRRCRTQSGRCQRRSRCWANRSCNGPDQCHAYRRGKRTHEKGAKAGPSGLGLTLGHYGRRDRVFAYWALADGIFADWIFADRRGGRDRLRPRQVGSNCCSDEGQRSDAEDHELQHQSLHTVNHGSLESTKIS